MAAPHSSGGTGATGGDEPHGGALAAAVAAHRAGRLQEALAGYEAVLAAAPEDAKALYYGGLAAHQAGDPATALARLEKARAALPGEAQLEDNLGVVYQAVQRWAEAEAAHRRALALVPGRARTLFHLGLARQGQGRPEDALAAYAEAARAAPGDARIPYNAGNALKDLGRYSEAIGYYQKALALRPGHADTQRNMGICYLELGRVDDALACYAATTGLAPAAAADLAGLRATAWHYSARSDAATCRDAMAEAGRAWAAQVPAAEIGHIVSGGGGIAILAKRLQRHPDIYLAVPALRRLAARGWRLHVFDLGARPDDPGAPLRDVASTWHPVGELDESMLAARLRAVQPDILLDLAGYEGARAGVIVRRVAPVQAKWVGGLINSTQLPGMDYILGDPVEIPPGDEALYSETVVRLPHDYVCYSPPGEAPTPSALPMSVRGYPTFGCFNNIIKLSESTLALWARLLAAVPEAHLLIKDTHLGNTDAAETLAARLHTAGIDPARVTLEGPSRQLAVMARYGDVDIALDPHPYSGGLTTIEALWMGVPVVSLPGPTIAGRHAATHLTNAGLSDWIARDGDAYIAQAANWARSPADLASLRARLRDQVAAGPLADIAGFTDDFERAIQAMLAQGASGGGPIDLAVGSRGGA